MAPLSSTTASGTPDLGKLAQGRVGGAHVLDVELVFHLPVVGAGRLDLVAEPLAEKLAQELGGDRLFLELREFSAGFQVGPVNGDFVGAVLGRAVSTGPPRSLGARNAG